MDESLINTSSSAKPHRTYAIRWWLLFLVSLLAGNQGGTWLVYGVIAEAVKPLYGWDDATIALISQWGPICYLVAAWPSSYLLDVAGLRTTVILSSFLCFLGGVCRCMHYATDGTGTILVHAGQILNGLVGPVAMSIAPPLSAQWFAPEQRVLATAIASTANYGGSAVFFVLGAKCVPVGPPEQVRSNLWKLQLGMCAFSGALLLACLLTFPRKPPSAPSVSAAVARAPPLDGLAKLASSVPFWLLTLSYGVVSGVFQSWGSLLGPILQNVNATFLPTDVAEAQAGWLGMYGALAGIVGGVCLGLFADRMLAAPGRRKRLLLTSCGLGALGFGAFSLACTPDGGPFRGASDTLRVAVIYASSIFGSLWANAATPLYYELAVEATYPVAEGLTTALLTLIQNAFCFCFLVVPQALPQYGTAWMSWAVVVACGLGMLVLLPLVEPRRRLAVDTHSGGGGGGMGGGPVAPAAAGMAAVAPQGA